MASITSLSGSSSSTSSIYSNSNAITGLASGLDTESMIEQATSSYKNKIESLQKKQTKVEWQQTAYRDIIDKIATFRDKYTSMTSSSCLRLNSFFTKSTNTNISGTYANLVSASGKSSSTVSLLGVKQLATSAKYSVEKAASSSVKATDSLDLTKKMSLLSGSMSLEYTADGKTKKIDLNFDAKDEDLINVQSQDDLVNLLNKKLSEYTLEDGTKASDLIRVENGANGITFSGKSGETVNISKTTGGFAGLMNKETDVAEGETYQPGLNIANLDTDESGAPKLTTTRIESLNGQSLTVTLNGTAKTIRIDGSKNTVDDFSASLQQQLNDAFGSGKITVSTTDGKLSFEANDGASLVVNGSALTELGFQDSNQSTYLDTSDTLESLMEGRTASGADDKYTFCVNGTDFTFDKTTKLSDMIDTVNKSGAGVNVSFSALTNKFTFTAKETGTASKVELSGDLADGLFGGGTVAAGQDAVFTAEVNGDAVELTRSSNTVDLDGMEVTLKGSFGYEGDQLSATAKANAVTFETSADTQKVVDTVKSMIEELNEFLKDIRTAYTTKPLTNTSGERYEPLSDDDKSDMSESAINNYETKAKTGLLYQDQELYSMYNSMINAVTGSVVDLEKIGVTVNYEGGTTSLSLDEDKLTKALNEDMDSVTKAFVGTDGNGFMGSVETVMKRYGSVTGTKGILVQKSGSTLAPSTVSENTLQSKIKDYQEQIKKWQEKLTDKIDYYTKQFTTLEKLISQMNSQSSALSGLTGSY